MEHELNGEEAVVLPLPIVANYSMNGGGKWGG